MLRRQLYLLAGRWCPHAVCSVARKLVPMLLKIMQTGEPFDLHRWQANRRQQDAA